MPVPDPVTMMDFGTFDPAYNFAWPDPLSTAQSLPNMDVSMDQTDWSNVDWSSLQVSGLTL